MLDLIWTHLICPISGQQLEGRQQLHTLCLVLGCDLLMLLLRQWLPPHWLSGSQLLRLSV